MEKKNKEKKIGQDKLEKLYDLSTPLWDAYHRSVRKTVRFPRYYKASLNW